MAESIRLEAQKGQEMEQLKAELDMELQAERTKVQEEREDKVVSVKKVTADEFKKNTFLCVCMWPHCVL